MEAAGKRLGGGTAKKKKKLGEANNYSVTEGSRGLKINMIRRKTGERLMEGNKGVEGVSKWWQVQ